LITFLSKRGDIPQGDDRTLETAETQRRFALMDGNFRLPAHEQGKLVVAFVPVVLGCSHACSFCVIPSRRGAERSRPSSEICAEVRSLVAQGVREVTFLGQIVDRYGKDIPAGLDLASLLRMVHEIEGLERIRFLTSHPSYMTSALLKAMAELPKVMPHIEVPVQAGDDLVLTNMRRGYTTDDYRRLVERIRQHLDGGFPGVSIATDVIVGFPGESEAQFMRTYDLLAELKMDVAHLARYSPRNGTVAQRTMADNVDEGEKMRRFRLLEELQEGIAAQINARYLEKTVDVLFEEQVKGRWKGRTSTNKLVFVESARDLTGLLLPVRVTWTGPWSMQAKLLGELGNHL
jgi:tRNA-2-methylthio-N6-dimethylallyladenosine synthase